MSKKMTKREHFNRILSYANAEDVEFIKHEIELLDNKNGAERKPSAKTLAKRENDAVLRDAIVAEMEVDVLYTASDLLTLPSLSAVADLTTAKVSYLMRDLVADGKVVKSVEKRRTYYKLA
jgi:hypothetical protein